MKEFLKELEKLVAKHSARRSVNLDMDLFHSTVDIPGIPGSKEGSEKRIPGPQAVVKLVLTDKTYPQRLADAAMPNRDKAFEDSKREISAEEFDKAHPAKEEPEHPNCKSAIEEEDVHVKAILEAKEDIKKKRKRNKR